MREIKLNHILMDGREWPIYCDLNVLEEIQDRFQSISEFDRKIAGWEIVRDENGHIVKFTKEEAELLGNGIEEGDAKVRKIMPRISAVKTGLYLMIREGLYIEADQKGNDPEEITEEYIARICDVPYDKASVILTQEMHRCFETKKKEKKKKANSRST